MDDRKILVTGSRGFIGAAAVRELEHRGIGSIAFDYPCDVTNRDEVLIAAENADGIINLAGILGTAEIFGAEYEAAEVNILGAINVFDAAQKFDLPLVQIATGHEGQPNPYAITKLCATQLAMARAQFSGLKVNSVKAYHVYGPGQKMCAPHGTSKVRKIIPSFVARALTGMPIEINGTGEQMVDMCYLNDVAKVICDGLEAPYGRIMEAGTGIGVKVNDVARTVIQQCHSLSDIVYLPMRMGEPADSVVVAKNPLCKNPWPYQLNTTIDWYRDHL